MSVLLVVGGVVLAAPAPPALAAPEDVPITGHGFGHGRGLSQWGAFGYATQFGWTHQQILARYYSNAGTADIGNPQVTVRLLALDNRPLSVTSGQAFVVDGRQLAAGTAAQISRNADGTWQLTTRSSCTGPVTGSAVIGQPTATTVAAPGNDVTRMLTLCAPEARAYRGALTVVWDGALHTVNRLPMEDYLRGVVPRESPASWGDAAGGAGINALRAQAVAARSFAQAENRYPYAKTCDSTTCQVYGGAGLNGVRIEDARTDRAVADTSGDVMTLGGQVARTEFHSSSGGWTAGGTFPAVLDEGDVASPYHNWAVTLTRSGIAAAFGVGPLQSITVLSRNGLGADGGRVLSVRVTGTTRSVVVDGNTFRTALGLRSDWFTVGSFQPTFDPRRDDISPVAVAAARTAAGTVLAAVRGTDRGIWVATGTPAGFGAFQRIPGLLTQRGPAAVSFNGSRVHVHAIGDDRALWQTWTDVDAQGRPRGWAPWQRLGGVLTTAPAVASVGNDRLAVVARGTDGALWARAWTGAVWTPWQSLGGQAISAPALEVDGAGYRVRVVGADGAVWSRGLTATGGPGAGWALLPVGTAFAPAVSATAWWHRDIRAVATSNGTGGIRETWGTGPVVDIGGLITSAAALTEFGTTEVWAFARGGDNRLWWNVVTGSGATSSWRPVGGVLA
jgi:SpoIID/LytB domain protein